MSLRLSLYEVMAQHRLDAAASRRLQSLAGVDGPPSSLAYWLPRGLAVLAAALGGFGLILWIAAGWEDIGRFGRFGLLLAFIAATGLGAMARPSLRAPVGLLALFGIGGLFASFGQAYPTGADPWQLFALWALLALPLCLGVRSDVLWSPWALVVMCAVALWVHAQVGQRWSVEPDDLPTQAVAWSMAVLLVALLSRAAQRFTGAGAWSFRTAVTLMTCMLCVSAFGGLSRGSIEPPFWLALIVLALGAAVFSLRRAFDVFALSVVALALNVLVTVWLVHAVFDMRTRESLTFGLLLIGCVTAGLLAASVSTILRLGRRYGAFQ